jgi:hypothetical protein
LLTVRNRRSSAYATAIASELGHLHCKVLIYSASVAIVQASHHRPSIQCQLRRASTAWTVATTALRLQWRYAGDRGRQRDARVNQPCKASLNGQATIASAMIGRRSDP